MEELFILVCGIICFCIVYLIFEGAVWGFDYIRISDIIVHTRSKILLKRVRKTFKVMGVDFESMTDRHVVVFVSDYVERILSQGGEVFPEAKELHDLYKGEKKTNGH